jgi:hypothetical protein
VRWPATGATTAARSAVPSGSSSTPRPSVPPLRFAATYRLRLARGGQAARDGGALAGRGSIRSVPPTAARRSFMPLQAGSATAAATSKPAPSSVTVNSADRRRRPGRPRRRWPRRT